MPASLDTTNTMLAIIAAVSVLQGLVLIAVCVAGFKMYRSVTAALNEFDAQHVKPLSAKVDAVLTQAHQLGDRLQRRAEKLDTAIDETVVRVDQTTARVKSSVNDTVHRVTDAVSGIRAAIINALTSEPVRGGNGHDRHAHSPLPVDPAGRDTLHTQEHVGGF